MPSYQLIYHPLCGRSRTIAILLHELGCTFEPGIVEPFSKRPEFIDLNPAGDLPVLIIQNEGSDPALVCGFYACIEYLIELSNSTDAQKGQALMPSSPFEQAEERRIVSWFFEKFEREVSIPILSEMIFGKHNERVAPDLEKLHLARQFLSEHLVYFDQLTQNGYLTNASLGLADFVGAAYFSAIDYTGQLNWNKFPDLKLWYMRMKSRKSVREELKFKIPGQPPPEWYENPDF